MVDITKLPENIASKIAGMKWACDDIGMSKATIMIFDAMALKIEKTSRSSEYERNILGWLDGRLPAPRIIEAESRDGYSFLLMTKLPGEMACSENSLRNIADTVKALADGLKILWRVNAADCPYINAVSDKIIQARFNIENGLADASNFDPETFEYYGFKGIYDLYDYLDKNRPAEDLVFSHGDYCLPNIFVSGRNITGFLDWGNGGVADRWQDIALCVRSLRHNMTDCGRYTEADIIESTKLLFHELDIVPDDDKIRYFTLLDELF